LKKKKAFKEKVKLVTEEDLEVTMDAKGRNQNGSTLKSEQDEKTP
jgi:hypothetical protein